MGKRIKKPKPSKSAHRTLMNKGFCGELKPTHPKRIDLGKNFSCEVKTA